MHIGNQSDVKKIIDKRLIVKVGLTSPYNSTVNDLNNYILGCDTTLGTFSVVLPNIAGVQDGDVIRIKKIGGDNPVQVTGDASITGNYDLTVTNDVITLLKNDTEWLVISQERQPLPFMLQSDLLDNMALLSPLSADRLMYASATNTWSSTSLSPVGRELLADASYSDMTDTMGLGTVKDYNIGTSGNVVPLLSTSNTWSGLNQFLQGTEATPSIQFSTNTGLYNPESGAIGIVNGGTETIRLKGDTLYIQNQLWDAVTFGTDEYVSIAPTGLSVSSTNAIETHMDTSYAGTNYHMMFFNTAFDTSVNGWGGIEVNGTGVLYHNTSDYRLKTDIKPMDNGIDIVSQLKPRMFDWKDSDKKDCSGFIAHELQETVSEAVTGKKDGDRIQSIDTAKLVPYLVAAIKQISERTELIQKRIDEIKNR